MERTNVIKKFLQAAAVLATLLPAVHGWAQDAGRAIRRPTQIACQPAAWSPEARRYELEGMTVVRYDVDDDGRAASVRVARSSGWKILDQMSIQSTESCRFKPTADPQVVRTGLEAGYEYRIGDNGRTPPVPAALVAGSCQASSAFGAFVPFTGKVVPRADGMLVRFLLDEKGKPFGIKLEETDPAPVAAATAFIKSCRFTPATIDGRPVPGNLYGWLVMT